MDGLITNDILIWLPYNVKNSRIKSSTEKCDHKIIPNNHVHIVGENLYEGTGLIIPNCGKVPTLSKNNKISENKDILEDKLSSRKIPTPIIIEDTVEDKLDEIFLFEEITIIICHFLSDYENNIYPDILDYESLYNTLSNINITIDINLSMIPTRDFLIKLRDFRFPHPLYDKNFNITMEEDKSNLDLLNRLLSILWNKISFFNNGTLKDGYIPDYISFMGWNNLSSKSDIKENILILSPDKTPQRFSPTAVKFYPGQQKNSIDIPLTPPPKNLPIPILDNKISFDAKTSILITKKSINIPLTPPPKYLPVPILDNKISSNVQTSVLVTKKSIDIPLTPPPKYQLIPI
ncbi:Hypothetical protein HVR_LOCUS443 [uncultured virus]|nr:Hypothetical protein HVR_LOCUS443 [uncultured virus]